jgi:hypothetical protein
MNSRAAAWRQSSGAGCLYSGRGGLEWRTAARSGSVHVGVCVSQVIFGVTQAQRRRAAALSRAKPCVHATHHAHPWPAAARVSGPLSTAALLSLHPPETLSVPRPARLGHVVAVW